MTSPQAVRLRRMRWWDVEPAAALDATLFPHSAWSPSAFWSELAASPATRDYVVAVTDADLLVGYAGLMTVAGEATVQTLGVAADQQRRGIGSRLLDALLAVAVERSATQVFLEVAADNDPARRRYEAAGFTALARRRDYYAPGVDAVVMRRRLAAERS